MPLVNQNNMGVFGKQSKLVIETIGKLSSIANKGQADADKYVAEVTKDGILSENNAKLTGLGKVSNQVGALGEIQAAAEELELSIDHSGLVDKDAPHTDEKDNRPVLIDLYK